MKSVEYKRAECPDCGGIRVPVKHTDSTSSDDYIIRHHLCEDCGLRFKSVEKKSTEGNAGDAER